MKDLCIKNFNINEKDVNKIRSFRKSMLDNKNDYQIYIAFVQWISKGDYNSICKGVYLLRYMEKYRPQSDCILPMYRFIKNGDDSFFMKTPLKYRLAL